MCSSLLSPWPTVCSRFLASFFFHDPSPTDIYTLSLHDALPISPSAGTSFMYPSGWAVHASASPPAAGRAWVRSEEHTSELQSHSDLVCRLLLEKKKQPSGCRC